jgi:hypothetical protein
MTANDDQGPGDDAEAIEEAAEHADRAGQERREAARQATFAEDSDDVAEADAHARESAADREAADAEEAEADAHARDHD